MFHSFGNNANDSCDKAPSPPHIHIPPTAEDKFITLPGYTGFAKKTNQEDEEILQAITKGHYAVKAKEWKYESRRQAQSILAFLYLGPSSATRDITFLKEQGITMLLVIRDTTTASIGLLSGQKVANELGIVFDSIDVHGNPELIRAFPRAIDIINKHLVQAYHALKDRPQESATPELPSTWGKILVYCESGNERSATIVAAYLMAMYGLTLVEAIQYLQAQRFCVAFDDGHKNLLLSYEQLLEAQRCIREATVEPARTLVSVKAKRSRDKVDEEDEEMDMDGQRADDLERFEGRHFAPFS
jgi:serine/threonine/tyrosine-interacting protein